MKQFHKPLSLGLTLVLLFILGSIEIKIASHAINHQHHSAQTHSNGICAWMCAAAQTISTDTQVFSPEVSPLNILEPFQKTLISTPRQLFLPSRAPPLQTY